MRIGKSTDCSRQSKKDRKCVWHAAYGSNATVAKTEEELEDRHQSLYGDADSADDIKISMPRNDNADGTQSNGNAGNNQIPAQVQNGADSAHPLRVRPHLNHCLAVCVFSWVVAVVLLLWYNWFAANPGDDYQPKPQAGLEPWEQGCNPGALFFVRGILWLACQVKNELGVD